MRKLTTAILLLILLLGAALPSSAERLSQNQLISYYKGSVFIGDSAFAVEIAVDLVAPFFGVSDLPAETLPHSFIHFRIQLRPQLLPAFRHRLRFLNSLKMAVVDMLDQCLPGLQLCLV